MSTNKRKYHSKSFKSKVALEAIQERETINKIASRYEIHPNLVTTWKRQLLESLPDFFERNRLKKPQEEALKDELYQQIGKLKVENEWLKKKLNLSNDEKHMLVEIDNPELSISNQCRLARPCSVLLLSPTCW